MLEKFHLHGKVGASGKPEVRFLTVLEVALGEDSFPQCCSVNMMEKGEPYRCLGGDHNSRRRDGGLEFS